MELHIIDDMRLKALPKHSSEYVLEVVMRRYENRSTIITSNRPIEHWGKLLGRCAPRQRHPGPLPKKSHTRFGWTVRPFSLGGLFSKSTSRGVHPSRLSTFRNQHEVPAHALL